MSADYPVTETILGPDGLDAEAYARLYRAYISTESIFGTVPMEIDDTDDELTVTIRDPMEVSPDDASIRQVTEREIAEHFGVPPKIVGGGDADE